MKTHVVVLLAGCTALSLVHGAERDGDAATGMKPQLPDFKIEKTTIRQFHVEESPEMSGLPPIKGEITVQLLQVKEPNLPDPPPPPPALRLSDPAVQARLAEARLKYHARRFAFVSGSVYNDQRTLLKFYPPGGGQATVSVWSNLDFKFFCGMGQVAVPGTDGKIINYDLIMAISDAPTGRFAVALPVVAASLPELANGGPAFVFTGEGASDETTRLVQSLHDLYRTDGPRLEAAYRARIKATEDRREFLLANPPSPKDLTIHFWKRAKIAVAQPNDEGSNGQ